MRLDLGFDHDFPRRREVVPEQEVRRPEEQVIERERHSDPILKRLDSLRERAADCQLNHHRPSQQQRADPVSRRTRTQVVHIPDRKRDRDVPLKDERRPQRHRLPHSLPGLQLRPEERKLLTEAGRFRVIRTEDIRETIYGGRKNPLENDLVYLRSKGLVKTEHINLRRDGRRRTIERTEVVTLTKQGRDLVRRFNDLPADQKVYAELVKPREVEHDSRIYRAYLKESERIEKDGGRDLRVKLDFELKSQVQKAIYAARKADPERDITEIKKEVAGQLDLPYVDDQIQIPDARIEYERNQDQDQSQGSISGHSDIEVLTAAYRPGHVRAKVRAGFRTYASASDRSSLTARVEDDHHLLYDILDL